MSYIAQNTLQQLFYYEPDTGMFFWRVPHGNKKPGDRAGWCNRAGVWKINLGYCAYDATYLAKVYELGEWETAKLAARERNDASPAQPKKFRRRKYLP